MKMAHGPHASVTRNHCFSYEEDLLKPPTITLGSSNNVSFISSKSNKVSNKFLRLSILTSRIKVSDSIDRSTGFETEGLSRGDFECPQDSEDEGRTEVSKSTGDKLGFEVILQGTTFF